MRFDVLTLFPEMFESYLGQSILKLAIQRQLVDVQTHNFRDFAEGRHKQVDDKPFGGGPGMLLMCPPVFDCVESVLGTEEIDGESDKSATADGGIRPKSVTGNDDSSQLIMMSPQGRKLDQKLVEELAQKQRLVVLCGRYEGFDDRIREGLQPMEISAGDFICNGGEVPAMLLIDTVIRLIPGVLGDETSSKYDSFSDSGLLEYPQFTRPREFRGMTVPNILLSGNHEAIAEWRREQSLKRTAERRGDLLEAQDAGCTGNDADR
ncbi:MAG: tRNA (guanosine(37)-N1)-methyltransferase TrmD [Fuerstiella sp.]|nr:tRNA (guanosine(37)-N1)-methyltransferase TrmD [Fuerstiella sp.]MCP4505364.1 tRNA (guanosine(37)-N1)-methyltransferase TrmD [Fuerstiella sp.]